jgi:hypothetical protein
VTPRDRYTVVSALPKQSPDTNPDAAGDDFETLLEASTAASPTVERIRRLVPPEVCKHVEAHLECSDHQSLRLDSDVDRAVLHLVRLCRIHRQPGAYGCILQSMLDHDALADIPPDIAQEIVSVAFAGPTKPPAVIVDTCVAVLGKGLIGDDLASRFAVILGSEDGPDRTEPGRDGPGGWPPPPARTGRVPRPSPARRRGPRLYRGGRVEFGGNVVGPVLVAGWSRTLQLALLTIPLLLLALAGLVVFYLQLRPDRWLGAAPWAAVTAAAGRVGWRWSRRRSARWRTQASPR